MTRKTHSFTLILSGIDDLTDEVANAVYGPCNDATMGQQRGIVFVGFDRKAASFRDAVVSAMDDVERALPQAKVIRIESAESKPRAAAKRVTSKKK